MGRKAKIKASRKGFGGLTNQKYESDVNELEKLSELRKNPDFEMAFMDPHVPVYVFTNEKTGELAILGDPEVIPEIREAWSNAVAETLSELEQKASLN